MPRVLKEIIKLVVIAILIAYPIRHFVVQPFFVHGSSMEPNFYTGEYLVIDELSLRFRDVKRGDVVVLRFPLDRKEYFIKRVIGLPGERVRIHDGRVIVHTTEFPEGRMLDESRYLDVPTPGEYDKTLTEREYFVLGDNRSASSDSRRWGPLDVKDIIGRVWIRAFPISRAAVFPSP